jgi:hypothetical protein
MMLRLREDCSIVGHYVEVGFFQELHCGSRFTLVLFVLRFFDAAKHMVLQLEWFMVHTYAAARKKINWSHSPFGFCNKQLRLHKTSAMWMRAVLGCSKLYARKEKHLGLVVTNVEGELAVQAQNRKRLAVQIHQLHEGILSRIN